jgi:phosphoribosylformylglycinamidine cyclo-ligase
MAPDRDGLTYEEAGVDVEAQDRAAEAVAAATAAAGTARQLEGGAGYAGLVDLGDRALGVTTDGVGTKLMVADAVGRYDTIGIDCVAMNANDLVAAGVDPVAFVDYLAVDDPGEVPADEVAQGLARGADEAGMAVVGGETAVLPEVVTGFDIAGTAVGLAPKDAILDPATIEAGDAVVGAASTGIHSNGYTLARAAAREAGVGYEDEVRPGTTLADLYLTPTRIYVEAVDALREAVDVKGIAHVTGGGWTNLTRLRDDLRWVVDDPLPVPEVFEMVREWGDVARDEMYRTFNMGLGLAAVVEPDEAEAAGDALASECEARVVGSVEDGTGVACPPRDVDLDPG